jgi:Skp family chaperone for outer membrane proteins
MAGGSFLRVTEQELAGLEKLVDAILESYGNLEKENRELANLVAKLKKELASTESLRKELQKQQAEVEQYFGHRERIRERMDGLLAKLEMLELPVSVTTWSPES